MSNFWKSKVARESIEGENVIDGLSNITPVEENLDQQLVELTSADQQMEALDRDQETLSDDTARVEAAVDAGEAAVEAGEELSEESIKATEVATESTRRRWGCSGTRIATESYRRSRGMTKAALEGWKEVLKDLYDRFIELCKTIRGKFKDLTLKYFNAGKTAQSRSKAYAEKLKNLGSKKKKDDISGGFINKLSINGKFDLANSIAIAKDMVSSKGKAMLDNVETQAGKAAIAVQHAADNGELKFGDDGKFELVGAAAGKLSGLTDLEGVTDSTVKALPGNSFLQMGSKSVATADNKNELLVVLAFTTTGEANEDKTIPTPNASELSSANKSMEIIGKSYETVLKDFRGYESAVEKLEKAAEKASNSFNKATEDAAREHLRAARSIADQSLRNLQTSYRAINFVAGGVLGGLNGFIGAGIAAYEPRK